jgi:hypothetical protein
VIGADANAENYSLENLCVDGSRGDITPSSGDLYNSFYLVVSGGGAKNVRYCRLLLKNSWGRTLQTGVESGSNYSTNVLVDDVVVLNSGTKAISATKTIKTTIQNCYVEVDPYSAIENPAGTSAESGSCYESNNSANVLFLSCQGKQIGAIKAPGIRLINGGHDIKVDKCAIEGSTYLGFVQNVDDVQFTNSVGTNVISGFLVVDSDVSQPTDTCKRIYISHNKINQYSGAAAIIGAEKPGFDSCVETYLHDNIFIGNAKFGISNKGVIAPATGGLCQVFEWRNTFEGTILNGIYTGQAPYEIQPNPDNSWKVVASSSVGIAHTGTTAETILAAINIAPNAMGPKGRLRITTSYSYTNSGNNKIALVRFNAVQAASVTLTTSAQLRSQIEIANRNSLSSQLVSIPGNSTGFGTTTTELTTMSVDTSTNRPLTLTAALANAGETITLESYVIEALYSA